MTTPDFVISAMLNGVDLDAGPDVGYELHVEARNNMQQQWRKQSVTNPFVEGEYDVLAVRANAVENVPVWVYGTSPSDCRRKVQFLVESISKPSFTIVWTTSSLIETWDCTFSEYSVNTQAAFQYDHRALVTMAISRRPSVRRTYADGTTVTS